MLKQIQKRTAKKLYEQGKDVLFVPCNMSPSNDWNLGIWENKDIQGQYATFTQLVNNYTYYNCNTETGRYIHFYIKA